MVKEIAFTEYPAKNVAGLRRRYEEKLGLRFDTPVCRVAYLQDAEGNKVSLHQITVSH